MQAASAYHWDSATGVRVSILTCLLAGAAAL